MGQTEEQFYKYYEEITITANEYIKALKDKEINDNFLKYCFLTKKDDKIVQNIENNELLIKTALFKRGLIAEGFHSCLKRIANERKGLIYNISKLYDLLNNRLQNYVIQLLAANQCDRIKKDLFQKQAHFNISPVKECHCHTNLLKKLLTQKDNLP